MAVDAVMASIHVRWLAKFVTVLVDGTTQQILTVLGLVTHPFGFEVALLRLILPLRKVWVAFYSGRSL